MSAHCSKCGSDIVYPAGTWPIGTCARCDMEKRAESAERQLKETTEALAELSEKQADAKAYSVFSHEGKWLVDEETWVELHAAIDRALAVSPADTTPERGETE